ncbi:MAG: cytochrome c biogenesis CcdA family protein [Clostridium sp.]|uniref:cytochrome c biogenesis CcdA family protein n=1 Tax=Clostridium sp. TaxID=1506 RepID=UPI003F350DF6
MNLSIMVAFFAGVVSFLSPCILPLIPAYINILAKDTQKNRKDIILKRSLIFILGFTVVFIIMGASATIIGKIFNRYFESLRILSGILIIIFGIYTLEIIKIGSIYKEKKLIKKVNEMGPFLMGIVFAAGWTPCVGPILGSILTYTSINTSLNGILMLGLYSLGLGIPFILSAMLIEHFSFVRKNIYKHMRKIKVITGVLMILVGILVATNKLVIVIGLIS